MTSRERVLAALKRETVDRVPFVEMVVDEEIGCRLLGISPQGSTAPDHDPVINQNLLGGPSCDPLALAECLNLDALGISFWLRHEGVEAEAGDQSRLREALGIISVRPVDLGPVLAHARVVRTRRRGGTLGVFLELAEGPQ